MTYCVWLDSEQALDPDRLPQLGGKAATLARLAQAGFPVLPGFVLHPQAFWDSLTLSNGHALREGTHRLPSQLAPAVLGEVQQALEQLGTGEQRFAVRSSAREEDGAQQSFAGQLDTVLGVAPADVEAAILKVWRSAFSTVLAAYHLAQGMETTLQPPAILIQPMLAPNAAGVAFTADPLTGRRSMTVIQAVYGLAAGLVAGEVAGDCYRVSREGQVVERRLSAKETAQWLTEAGQVEWVAIAPDHQNRAVLTDTQIQAVARLARQVSHSQSCPQDVEWALVASSDPQEPDSLYLLQARPITTLAQQPDPDGTYCLWDNSNIVESYSGVTTPLTFSFARKAYTEVYRQFCRFMGVPSGLIEQNRTVFSNMIGFLHGRIYYNLLNWYRVLTLLPGYRLNARFLEQMLGVQQGLPDGIVADIKRQNRVHPLTDAGRLIVSTGRILGNYLTLPQRIHRYQQRLNRVLLSGDDLQCLPDLRPDELVRLYRQIEGELLTHWDAPLINDFFAMIFYGVLKKLTLRWGNDSTGSLQNDLISVTGDVISAEPARRLRHMANELMGQPEAVQVFCTGSLAEIQQTLAELPALEQAFDAYLTQFGDRCLEELKLESPTLADDPLPLLRTIGCLAQRQTVEADSPDAAVHASFNRRLSEQELLQSLQHRPIQRWLLTWVLNNTRRLVRNRENLRFERTRVFGQARRVFLELGKRFYALGLLDQPTDIFFLEVEEIMGLVEGSGTTTDLRGLAAVRQAQWQQQQSAPPLPRRLETFGLPYLAQPVPTPATPTPPLADQDGWQGTGCSPGTVRGRVSLVSNPRHWLQARTGFSAAEPTLLVAQSTDPGWVLLFPHAKGLLVERGSLLSHVAIVARELGLPMISDLPNITTTLQEGDWVEMDGQTGQIRRLAVPAPASVASGIE